MRQKIQKMTLQMKQVMDKAQKIQMKKVRMNQKTEMTILKMKRLKMFL